MFRLAVFAFTVPSVSADCVSDLEKIGADFVSAGLALKNIVSDCSGDDRTKCQADVDGMLTDISQAVADVDGSVTSCGNHGPACVAEIKKLSAAIAAIDPPAKKMADECAGKHKSMISCALDGVKVGTDVVEVGKEVVAVTNICKKGIAVKSKMYSCDSGDPKNPWVTTTCIKSSWTSWKDDRAAFQRVCNDGKGRLVDFPDDSKAIDCGKPCFACSFIAVCCDPKGPPNAESDKKGIVV